MKQTANHQTPAEERDFLREKADAFQAGLAAGQDDRFHADIVDAVNAIEAEINLLWAASEQPFWRRFRGIRRSQMLAGESDE